MARIEVGFKNEKTGEIRQVKVGWSWVLFLFSGFLGIPLFMRKLNMWGGVFLILWAVNFLVAMVDVTATILIQLVILGLLVFLGIKGNEMTAKNYLENGWVFSEPDSSATKFGKGKWGLGV